MDFNAPKFTIHLLKDLIMIACSSKLVALVMYNSSNV